MRNGYPTIFLFLFISCTYTSDPVPSCPGSTLNATVENTQESGCTSDEGILKIKATGGVGTYSYRLNSGPEGMIDEFSKLFQGNYTITVIDEDQCTIDIEVKVLSGITYTNDTRPIFVKSCAITGCHVAGTGLPQWLDYDVAKANVLLIKSLTQSRFMPAEGSLTQQEIDILACWADDGGPL